MKRVAVLLLLSSRQKFANQGSVLGDLIAVLLKYTNIDEIARLDTLEGELKCLPNGAG